MNKLALVVADTTPVNYLILIGQSAILGSLFDEVLIPEAVMAELRHPAAPQAVKDWLASPPAWLRVAAVRQVDATLRLGAGEAEAISLAIERRVKVVLMDERRGRLEAEARGLLAVGTLNLIELADERGVCDGLAALNALRATTFRAAPALLERLAARLQSRRS